MATGITSIEYVRNIGSTPARVNRKTGHLQINMDVFPRLKDEHKAFVLLHEEGHVVLDSSDEMAVDEYAFKKYAALGYSLTESVKALTQVLNSKSPEHTKRAYLQLQRALEYDNKNNKNKDAYRPHYTGIAQVKQMNMNPQLHQLQTANEYDGLFGLSKKEKAKKAAKIEMIKAKPALKIAKKEGAIQQKLLLAQAGKTKAGSLLNGIGGIASGIGGIISGTGGGSPQAEVIAPAPAMNPVTLSPVPGVPVAMLQSEVPVSQQAIAAASNPKTNPTTEMLTNTGGGGAEMVNEGTQTVDAKALAPAKDEKKKGNNTMMIIGAAVVLVLVFLFINKKK